MKSQANVSSAGTTASIRGATAKVIVTQYSRVLTKSKDNKTMRKRIKQTTRVAEDGKTIHVASIQVQTYLGLWHTICTKEDDEEWVSMSRAAEAMSYLGDEMYVEQNRLQDASQVSQ